MPEALKQLNSMTYLIDDEDCFSTLMDGLIDLREEIRPLLPQEDGLETEPIFVKGKPQVLVKGKMPREYLFASHAKNFSHEGLVLQLR